jgi:ADP-ribose pyrophosphatase YjhB (NUDIX family)
MERCDLVALVQDHQVLDALEGAAKARFLSELDRLERPWDQTADPVHVTASAVVTSARGTLLHRHRVLRRWLQPGGHLEAGEWPHEAARREVAEETGLEAAHPGGRPCLLRLDVHRAGTGLRHTHLDLCYLVTAPALDPVPGPGESPEVRWWAWEEAEALADRSLQRALQAARSWSVT